MTSRNLNRTWIDVIKAQYKEDFDNNVPFPVRYLLHNPKWKADLFYLISNRIDPEDFKNSIIDFNLYTRHRESPDFEDENIKIWRRVPQHIPDEVKTVQEPSSDQTTTERKDSPLRRRQQHVEEKLAARAAAAGS